MKDAVEPVSATISDMPCSAPAGPSDSWFRSVVEAANEGVWIIDLEAKTIFANERMAAMLATTPEKLIGRTPFEFLSDSDRLSGADIMARNFEGTPVEFEITFLRADGEPIPVLAGSAPLRDEGGAIVGSVATFSDLTARKTAEDALSRSEREAKRAATLLNQLLESATDAIWLRDPDGRFQVANPAAVSVMGVSRDGVIGAPLESIWPSEVAAHLRAETDAMLGSGSGITVEEEMFDVGRNRVTTFLSNKVPIYAPDGAPIGILGVSRDITDRKRAEDELRASEERLAHQVAELNALYASAPIGLAFFDRNYRYVRINAELAKINGLPADAHTGRTVRDLIPRNADSVEPLIDRVFETGEVIGDIEIQGETPLEPGVTRHWLTGFYPVRGAAGAVEAVGAWVVEISERKAAEQRELLLAREVDHRAKNLLAVVQSIVQLTPAEDAEELKDSVVGRIQALARAHSLLSDARWDGVDLGQLVAEELAPFSAGVRVTFNGPPLKLRPAAAQSLALVLHELATNAAKYGALSESPGSLHVEWKRGDDERGPCLEISWRESDGPSVAEPEVLGFGSNIIRTSVERQLRGKVTKEWRAEGLVCTLRIPAAEIAAGPDG